MTTSTTPSPTDKPLILPFQQPIFDRLCAVARACLYVDRRQFSALKFRACFWLIGRTGSGKTFLASALAREMQVPYLTVAISDWMILGGTHKGGAATWPVIFQFIEQSMNARGAIIFIDELDKCGDSSNYNSFLRSEVFSLCDARIPLGILDTDGDPIPKSRIDKVAEYLANKTLVIGGAAFQGIWESLSCPALGFNPSPKSPSLPELPDLARILPRELINRFSSEIFILPEILEADYRMMVEQMAKHVPDTWRKRFLELGLSRIEQAVRHQKGARFLEETLLTAIVEERAALTNFVPDPMETPKPEKPNEDLDLRVF
jgi:SpoVK/Ycf46/Vps4 family AAA+-type ATPase